MTESTQEQPANPKLNLDGKEYDFNSLTDEQKVIFNHIVDLERKIGAARFNLDQLSVGRQAFVDRLKASLSAN